MSGHRRGKLPDGGTPPTRRNAAIDDYTQRVIDAPTAQAQVAVAFDFLRWAAKRSGQPEVVLHEAATFLFARAQEVAA